MELASARDEETAVAGGTVSSKQVVIDELIVGPFNRLNVEALVIDLQDPDVSAILGWSFLESFRIVIDPRRRWVELEGPRRKRLMRSRRGRAAMVLPVRGPASSFDAAVLEKNHSNSVGRSQPPTRTRTARERLSTIF